MGKAAEGRRQANWEASESTALYNYAARNGTTFFFLTIESALFCGGRKCSSTYFTARSTNCEPEFRPSLRLMFSRWVSIVLTLRFNACAIFFVPSPEPI